MIVRPLQGDVAAADENDGLDDDGDRGKRKR